MLLKEYSVASGSGGLSQREAQHGLEESNLPVNCVLQQILNVQRLVYDFFSSTNLNEALSYDQHTRNNNNCDSSRDRIIQEELLTNASFKRYQYGATALDCSLMISFQRIATHALPIDEALTGKFLVRQEGVPFLSKIAIMDLDPKPFTHAHKYVEQTQASYQSEWSRRQSIYECSKR